MNNGQHLSHEMKYNGSCLSTRRFFLVFTKCLAHHTWWISCRCFTNPMKEGETDNSWARRRQSISNTAGVSTNPKTPKGKAIKSRRQLAISVAHHDYHKVTLVEVRFDWTVFIKLSARGEYVFNLSWGIDALCNSPEAWRIGYVSFQYISANIHLPSSVHFVLMPK